MILHIYLFSLHIDLSILIFSKINKIQIQIGIKDSRTFSYDWFFANYLGDFLIKVLNIFQRENNHTISLVFSCEMHRE